jgi:DNA adenine methylase
VSYFDYSNRAKPILKWAGGKSNLLPQLIPYFPIKFNRYIEPFIGGGAVFFSLASGGVPSIINDFNYDIYTIYKTIRDKPNDFMKYLDKYSHKYSEEFYYHLRSINPKTDIEKSARTLFLNKTGFNGLYRLNSQGKFNVPFGKKVKCPALYDKDNLLNVSRRLKNTSLCNKDFEIIINQAESGDFIYCDPPYEPLSVTSSFNSYNSGGFSFIEQERLYQACKKAVNRGVFVIISNSCSPKIIELYKNWDNRRVLAKRSINSKGNGRGEIEEILVIMSDKGKNNFQLQEKINPSKNIHITQ